MGRPLAAALVLAACIAFAIPGLPGVASAQQPTLSAVAGQPFTGIGRAADYLDGTCTNVRDMVIQWRDGSVSGASSFATTDDAIDLGGSPIPIKWVDVTGIHTFAFPGDYDVTVTYTATCENASNEPYDAFETNVPLFKVRVMGSGTLPIGSVTPELGKTVGAKVVRGKVLVAVRGGAARRGEPRASQKGLKFVPLRGEREIPVGSFLDTRRGTVELASATGRGSTTQSGQFSSGLFQVLQSRARRAKGLTELRLKGASSKSCRARSAANGPGAEAAALSKKTINKLRADAKGKYRSRTRHSAATVRGTVWITAERCDGTLTTVKRGKVSVRDLRRGRTITLSAGQSYLARAG